MLINNHTSDGFQKKVLTALALFFLEGLIGLFLLASIPSDSGTAGVSGFSSSRIALLVFHSAALAGLACLLIFRNKVFPFLHRRLASIPVKTDKLTALGAVLLAAFAWIPLQVCLGIFQTTGSYREFAYYQRLLPTLGWFFLIGLQLLVWIFFKNCRAVGAWFTKNLAVLLPALAVFCLFVLVAVFSAATGIGLTPDKYGWGAPGVPLMEWQIWLSVLIALALAAALRGTFHAASPLSIKDILIFIGVWAAAAAIWGAQPVPPGFFATPGRLPNFEVYPFSDGAFYDFYAQNIVIGNGYRGLQIPPRPLYILFLAFARFVAGQDYHRVVLVQTLLLALIPAGVYLLGRIMHSTGAGLAAAGMAILRELTSILSTPFTDDISNSKLLFADLPATLGIVMVLVCVSLWLRDPSKRSGMQMAAGLSMGILLLVRTQSLLLLPVIFLTAVVVYRRRLRQFALDFTLLVLTMLVCVAPWLIRNYAIAGSFIFDHPESQSRVMAQRYDYDGDFDAHERLPGEETGDYSRRLSNSIRRTIIEHPLYVAEFITAHFLNNEIADLLILPVRGSIDSPRELVFPSSPFWQDWNGQISWKDGLLLAANLLIISLGVGASWRTCGMPGLLPLLVNFTYNLSTAVARFSGWRYLLPVDWIAYFYFSIGMIALVYLVFRPRTEPLRGNAHASDTASRKSFFLQFPPLSHAAAAVILSILVGSSLVLAEKVIPARYTQEDNLRVIPAMLENPVVKSFGVDLDALADFSSQPNTFIVRGMALYPRYYAAGEGEAKTAKTGYEPSPDSRLVFLTAGTPDGLTILRIDTPPEYFPSGADISVVGCQHPLFAEALIVTLHGERETTYFAPDAGSLKCEE